MKPIAIGGVADHVHMLVSLPPTLSVAKALQLLKGNSSKWIHETFPKMPSFEWQQGYGAFSIGVSGIDATASYIRNQTEHRRARFAKNSWRCSASTASIMTNGCLIDSFVPVGTRSS